MGQHVDNARLALSKLLEQRRDVVNALAQPYSPKTPELWAKIVQIQQAQQALEEALANEEEMEPRGPLKDRS